MNVTKIRPSYITVQMLRLNENAHNVHKIWFHVAVCYEVYSWVGSSYKLIGRKKYEARSSGIKYNNLKIDLITDWIGRFTRRKMAGDWTVSLCVRVLYKGILMNTIRWENMLVKCYQEFYYSVHSHKQDPVREAAALILLLS